MQWSDRVEQADWIEGRLDAFTSGLITSTVPRGFPAYARVLHPVEVPSPGQALRSPVRWADVAAWSGVAQTPQTPFRRLATPARPPTGPAPWTGQGPMDGSLLEPDASALVDVLATHTPAATRCWFALWDGWGWDNVVRFYVSADPEFVPPEPETLPDPIPAEVRDGPRVFLPARSYLLYTGALKDALAFVDSQAQTPQLWWPEDRSWCVATEIDDDVTYVAGTTDLIAALHADPRLETQPAHEGERELSEPARPSTPSGVEPGCNELPARDDEA